MKNKIIYILNFGYELFKNQLLTFNIGKEFDSKLNTGGNLIPALNLILGFGSIRALFKIEFTNKYSIDLKDFVSR